MNGNAKIIPGSAQSSGPTSAPPVADQIAPYVLVSISQQLDKWIAVLGYQNKLYSVGIGDKLPVDGAAVTAIDSHSISLKKGDATKKIDYIDSV